MRNRLTILSAALLVAPAISARAQDAATSTPAQQPPALVQPVAPSEQAIPWGLIDFGYRGTTTDGDRSRYDRYSDLRDGAASRIQIGHQTDQFMFAANALNIGYRDQQYSGRYTNGKATLFGSFNSVPLNYLNNAQTPWIETSPNVFTLDPLARTAVQNKAIGVVGVPQTAAQLQTASIYRSLADRVDLSQLRQVTNAGFNFDVSKNTAFNASFASTDKGGKQPWGASFAFNNANEVPLTVDNRTNELNAGLEFSNPKGMVKVGYYGSFFNNNIKSLVWDNPIRATDTNPYDPSGYSNGNGPAQGRMSMAPSNTLNTFTGTALYKFPGHSTLNGSLAYTTMNQNDALIPWTINPVIANATVYKSFPELASLPRATAEAKVDAVNALLNFNSRPNRYIGFQARYRFNDHVNKTPLFDATEYVRFDAVPEETGGETEQFNIKQNTAELSTTIYGLKYTSVRFSYIYDTFARTGRAFSDMTDNTFRASVDTVGNQWVTVRGIYEYTQRKGSGFSEDVIEEGGAQPGLRFYDEANRKHDKETLLFIVTPTEFFDVNFSVGHGRDEYNGPGHEFGLLDNSNTSYNVGVTFTPAKGVAFGANYGRDRYESNQMSRNANPAPDPTWTDPTRNWSLNNKEAVNNFNLFLDLPKIARNTNVKISYDYSDSDNGFLFGGPRIPQLAALGQFIPLPNVTNKWNRVTADVQYFFSKKVGVGFGYWYEKLDVNDWNTIDTNGPAAISGATGTPRIDWLGEINTGYGNRPYTGNTAFLRLLYNF